MRADELREKYLSFFKDKGHAVIPGSSLIPEHDPTVLFTTAGMHPLVPFLLGEKHPQGSRLTDVQKCIRTDDIEEVGDNWHLTFFEMLGNWSLGNYWKKEAIGWSFEFLTKHLNIPLEKLSVTVFSGDDDAPKDEESAKIWQELGIPKERIYYLPKEDNWWGPAGQTGPCGPCTEMFYDTGKREHGPDCKPGCHCGKYSEIWNDVFMEYNKTSEGKYLPLKQKNVDTGMGLERTTAVLNGFDNVFETELFQPIIKEIEKLTQKSSKFQVPSYRIIADHIKAATFILAESIEPSNVERGYILRRLIRRSVRYARQLGIKGVFCHKIAKAVIDIYKDVYPELKKNHEFIFEQLTKEEEKFAATLERGLREFEKLDEISGEKAFDLYQSYGFPLELTEELAKEKGIKINKEEFKKSFEEHQEVSRKGADHKFKGGLADHSKQTTKYHTATHLLLAALRRVLGDHVYQRGSNITAERLRFDFSHKEKLTEEELKKVEDLVNEKIKEDLKVKQEEMSLQEAKKQGAMGVFGEKYGDRVKVYSIGDFSKEICGGPHVKRTSELGTFKIKKEESSSSGVRRIRAVLE
jgi:alanyl-tRNA synthetase